MASLRRSGARANDDYPHSIATVTIIGAASGPIIDLTQALWYLEGQEYSIDGLVVNYDFSNIEACAAHFLLLDAFQAMADEAVAEYNDQVAQWNTVATAICVLRSDSRKACVDLFISQATALNLMGDNRLPDSLAPPGASRAQIMFDPDSPNLSVKLFMNTSSTIGDSTMTYGAVYPTPTQLNVTSMAGGIVRLHVNLTTGYCTSSSMRFLLLWGLLCGEIDNDIDFRKDGNGKWQVVEVLGNPFPSMSVYIQEGNAFRSTYQRYSDDPFALLNRKLDKINAALHDGVYMMPHLPPGGCSLQ